MERERNAREWSNSTDSRISLPVSPCFLCFFFFFLFLSSSSSSPQTRSDLLQPIHNIVSYKFLIFYSVYCFILDGRLFLFILYLHSRLSPYVVFAIWFCQCLLVLVLVLFVFLLLLPPFPVVSLCRLRHLVLSVSRRTISDKAVELWLDFLLVCLFIRAVV